MYKECRHIMPSGKKCHSPALLNRNYCYYHDALHRVVRARGTAKDVPLPPIEDSNGIQIALTQVLNALNSPFMDTRRAGLLLYGLQIAAQLTSHRSDTNASESVRTVCNESGAPIEEQENDGDVLAPEKSVCEPPLDCVKCTTRQNCNYFRLHRRRIQELEAEVGAQDSGTESD